MTSLNCLVFFVNNLETDLLLSEEENPTGQGLGNKQVTILNYTEKWLGSEYRIQN